LSFWTFGLERCLLLYCIYPNSVSVFIHVLIKLIWKFKWYTYIQISNFKKLTVASFALYRRGNSCSVCSGCHPLPNSHPVKRFFLTAFDNRNMVYSKCYDTFLFASHHCRTFWGIINIIFPLNVFDTLCMVSFPPIFTKRWFLHAYRKFEVFLCPISWEFCCVLYMCFGVRLAVCSLSSFFL